ncbi:hypothetical protein JIR001_31020 [Polycladomyces abyssicola]|uniref:Uncharacterized protein n=1 Tax=Polycladomyces abyssicola TaxID=1125966 RepID=A0A8D5UJI2_9BACL|nr:hypothetical protein JIR001_31020 [Polycladomyces abyssicola]
MKALSDYVPQQTFSSIAKKTGADRTSRSRKKKADGNKFTNMLTGGDPEITQTAEHYYMLVSMLAPCLKEHMLQLICGIYH